MHPTTLQTERLVLREWEEADLPAVQKYGTDPEVVRYMPWGPNTDDDARAFLHRCLANARSIPRRNYEFAMTDRISGELIGGCGIRISAVEPRVGDFGYILRRDCWGRGLATECAAELVRLGFEDHNLHRMWATCDVENTASANVLRKAGLQLEGTLRENQMQRGKWRTTLLFAILENEWRARKRNPAE